MHSAKKRIILSLLFLAITLPGCTPTGQKFKPLKNISSNSAAIYVYRPYNMIGGGKLYTILIDNQEMGKLCNGAYQTFIVTPGLHSVELKQDAFLIRGETFNVNAKFDAGSSYYLRFGAQWAGGKAGLMVVDEPTAQPELTECKKY